MAYKNDNVPVTDLLSPLNVTPTWSDTTAVRGEAKKDSLGRWLSGTVKVTHEILEIEYNSGVDSGIYHDDVYMQLRNFRQDGSQPMCVIAVPCDFGYTSKYIYQNIVKQGFDSLVSAYSDRTAYAYFLASIGQTNLITYEGRESHSRMDVAYSKGKDDKTEYPLQIGQTNTQIRDTRLSSTFNIGTLAQWMDFCNTGNPQANYYTTQRFTPQRRSEALRWTAEEPYNKYASSIMLSALSVNMVTGSGYQAQLYPIIGSKIVTNIPVFGLYDTEAIYNYFETGDTSGAENLDEIAVSDINLATDWIIYVNGKRYPDIFVTMASNELDEFLTSENNKTGLSASDFKVQYRYFYSPDNIPSSPEWRDWKEDVYNNTLLTSYKELYALEEGEWDNPPDAALENDYARLQFRIYYDEQNWSRWCYFKIGYIGSPSVPDFAKMQNEGDVVSISDGSTVTIVYDDFPPDIDDGYKDPKDDSNVGDDTENSGSISAGYNLLTTSYRMTDTNVQNLGGKLWGQSFFDNIKLLNNSPIENIVGLKIMPCAVNAFPSNVVIGNVDMDIAGDKVTSVPVVTVGSFSFEGYYNSFLDYAPYTQAIMFLPFIGFVEIDPAEFTGHTITVKYAFDIVMGQCKAMIFVDNIYVHSFDGVCGIDVPLVASNRAQVEGALLSSAAAGVFTGDLSVIGDYVTRQYHSERVGGYSSVLGWVETRTCYIEIIRPNAQYASTYGHDVGYPCELSCNLGTLRGFTVCGDNIDMSGFTCTEEEKTMIKEKLTRGVYL